MAQELSKDGKQLDQVPELDLTLRARLASALGTWQQWLPTPVAEPRYVEKLCGITNASIKVSDGFNDWVIRFNQTVADPGIHRVSEYNAMGLGSSMGICPVPAYIGDDILVTPYMAGDPPGFDQLELVGSTFAKIHLLDIASLPDQALDELNLSSYLVTCFKAAGEPAPLQAELQNVIESLPNEPKVLCHNDMLFENLLYSTADELIHVLDWEYAKLSPPSFDLATFCCHYFLNDEALQRLLQGYSDGISAGAHSESYHNPVTQQSIRAFEPAASIVEKLWFLIKDQR